ncbi:MAG: ATP-binding protein [Tidjanibacter sp.]|nr:ATP-binding protein [Tidjanibacter sp.]
MEEMMIKKNEATLLSSIDRVVELAIDSKLSNNFYEEADEALQYLSQQLDITPTQALVFSLFMEKCTDRRITMSDFAGMIGCRTTRLIELMSEADELYKMGLIGRYKRNKECYYNVPFEVIEAVKENRKFTPKSLSELSSSEFYDCLDEIFEADHDDTYTLIDRLRELVAANPQLPIAQVVKRYNIGWYRGNLSGIMLCVYLNRFVNHDDDMVGTHDWEDYFSSKHIVRSINEALKDNSFTLCKEGLVEPYKNDGMADTNYFHLTDKAKQELCPELISKIKDKGKDKRLIPHTSFAPKSLYYSDSVQQQIEQLTSLLQPAMFLKVTDRLAENGMRRGFACLFYGSPGTGKTETVNQIARQTGRDVMMVDVSKIKSCWVGESEKNIKEAFDHYRRLVESSERAPILLFNEADAILGRRNEAAERSVDKMENAIQNIILQEMEQLEGIMIATTNLTSNLDSAFERRFIYKIEFERPTLSARKSIWRSMIADLSEDEATTLASQFDLSGGQIENIARKRTVELILSGEAPDLQQLMSYCQAERGLSQEPPRRRIGF